MDTTTEVAEVLTSAANHKTATLATALGLTIIGGTIYGAGKLVGARRARKAAQQLPQVVQDNIRYIDAQAK